MLDQQGAEGRCSLRKRLTDSYMSYIQAFKNPIPSMKMMARLEHLSGNLKLLMDHLNNELGTILLTPCTGMSGWGFTSQVQLPLAFSWS